MSVLTRVGVMASRWQPVSLPLVVRTSLQRGHCPQLRKVASTQNTRAGSFFCVFLTHLFGEVPPECQCGSPHCLHSHRLTRFVCELGCTQAPSPRVCVFSVCAYGEGGDVGAPSGFIYSVVRWSMSPLIMKRVHVSNETQTEYERFDIAWLRATSCHMTGCRHM